MFRSNVIAMAAGLLCAGLPTFAAAQSEEAAGVVTTVNGDATLIRAVAAAPPASLQMRDEIFVRDRIHTQPRSLVRVLLGGKALITMRELSVLTVTEEAGRVTVDLQSGKIGVAVVKGRMRPGEVIEIRSPNATAAVRGTVFVVEVDPITAGATTPTPTTRVHLFQGALDVSAHLDPSQPAVRLAELQSVVVAGNTVGAVRRLSRDAVAALTADLTPKQMQTQDAPDEFKSPLMAREQGRAVLLASALLAPGTPSAPLQGVTGVVTGLTDTTAETLERLIDALKLGDGLGDTVGSLGGVVGSTVSGLGGTVGAVGGGLGGAVGGGLGSTVGGVGAVVGSVGSTAGATVGGAGGTVGGVVGGVGGTVGGLLGGLLGGPR